MAIQSRLLQYANRKSTHSLEGSHSMKCDGCGHFIRYSGNNPEKYTSSFTPESDYSYEEIAFHCAKCTELYGPPQRRKQLATG